MANSLTTVIIGAGAAGLFCARYAKAAGSVLVIDHAKAAGEKIRISGGGRCNFTNLGTGPQNFLSANPHFAKSALARFTPYDFIDLVTAHGIAFHEKTLGQLFCDGSAKEIIAMLMAEVRPADVVLGVSVASVARTGDGFALSLSNGRAVTCSNLVVATGGKSIPKMGASGFGYQIAEQFGHVVTDTRPGLVPLTFGEADLAWMKPLAGVALPARVSCNDMGFVEAVLFTHRGLSGPAILQISSYWHETMPISVNFLPGMDVTAALVTRKQDNGRRTMTGVLADLMPARLAAELGAQLQLTGNIADHSDKALAEIADRLTGWQLTPTGTEGYRTAEVTVGGVDTDGLSSRSMASKTVPGLYFIGEVVDVTGWLGGYNFQWAWASAHAAGTAITSG